MKKIIYSLLVFFIFLSFANFLGCKNKTKNLSSQKEIYLTFDDGPSAVTDKILAVLDEYKIKATFFVVGKCVEKNPTILKKIYMNGHSIGIHSYTHEYKKIYYSQSTLTDDIALCEKAIKTVLPDFKAKIYRFPGGSFNLKEQTKSVPTTLNLTYYDWNASICDAEGVVYSVEQLYLNAVNTSFNRKKIILLCHDCSNKENTALALPLIISHFKGEGYLFKTL